MSALDLDAAAARAAARGGEEKRRYVQTIFSEIAPRYDLLNHVLSLNIDRGWRRQALSALDWRARPRGVYLDLCAGTLDVAAMLVRERDFAGFVVGADFAEPMLRAGAEKSAASMVGPVVGDALELPIRDASADGAIVAFGIRNVADLDSGLREVHRVLSSGARFVILEFSMPRQPIIGAFYRFYFHYVLPLIGRLISGHKTAYRYLPESVRHFPVENELADRLRRAGFQQVTWRSLSFGIAAIHTAVR